jgi:hypothetical protein
MRVFLQKTSRRFATAAAARNTVIVACPEAGTGAMWRVIDVRTFERA